jgi:hypothetical protein
MQFGLTGELELSSGTLYIDTTTASMSGAVSVQGHLSQSAQGTPVAVFNFATIFLVSIFRQYTCYVYAA